MRPGHILDGRYELLVPYAQGGMATLWAARLRGKHGFEKLVAVKTMHPHFSQETAFRNMFLDEARIASRVRHPNVAAVEDLGDEAGNLYMIIEWVQGESLARLRHAIDGRGHAAPVDVLLRIVADACAGLHVAHELRGDDGVLLDVVHRDVSPQNILVSEAGVTKVIDFGIAKAVGRLSERTRTGLIKAKLEYASPEQAQMKPCDRRADVWALGMTLYEMLTGILPYAGKHDADTLEKLSAGRPPPSVPPSVPLPVAAVVMRALAHDPAARFATAAEMGRAIEAAMSRPVAPQEIAQVLRTYLASRLEEQKQRLAQALREAAERAGALPGGAGIAGDGPMRGKFPTLPPEVVPQQPVAGVAPAAAPEAPASAPMEPRLRAGHKVALLVATIVTIAVWTMVVRVLLHAGAPRSHSACERSATVHAA